MSRRLERLLKPRSVAVIGGKEAERVAHQLARIGFAGEVWPVHPTRSEMAARAVYPDLERLPGVPDACFVGVNRTRSVEVIARLAALGAGGAVCYASGFQETEATSGEGRELQRALVAAAGEMPIIGPNCYGLINYLDAVALWPDQHGGRVLGPAARGVAVLSQSSNIAINLSMQRRGVPIAYLLTVGNQAQTGVSALAEAVLDDDRVSALGLYLEAIDDVARFEALAARARELGKPIVAVKAGRCEHAVRSALTHTASVAGSDAANDALLARLGVARVKSLEALLETLKLLHVHGPLTGGAIASISCSGGEAGLMADAALDTALGYKPLDAQTVERLACALGPRVSVANPLDYHTYVWADREAMQRVFSALLGNGFDLSLLVIDFPRLDRCDDGDWSIAIDAFHAALVETGEKGAVIATLAENLPEERTEDLHRRAIAALGGVDHGLEAVDAAARIGRAWRRPPPAPLWPAGTPADEIAVLDEHAAKRALAEHGVPVPPGARATSVDEALAAAAALEGPLAIKALGVAHKTERRALRLGVDGRAAVARAAEELLGACDALLVERMVGDAVAELLVGVRAEPGCGLVLTLASGGVLVELAADARSLLLPVSEAQVREALSALGAGALIGGYRGGAVGDLDAAVAAIVAVTEFAGANRRRLRELDVNPLVVCAMGRGAWAVDALIALAKEAA